ncbi:MAG TPA: C4-type zinc ribbon domain-containing protein [bacterium]|nr:C4-type zinc ribbon domain-containing protein [bacterium]
MPLKNTDEENRGTNLDLDVLRELRNIDQSLVSLKAAFEKLKSAGDLTDDDIDVIMQEFENFVTGKVSQLDKVRNGLRALYERYYEKYHDRAIVSVKGGVCHGCFVTIPPMRLDIIRRMDSIEFCENCGRILIWEEE